MSFNNKKLAPNQNISFGTSTQLTILCTAINSRPRVNLKIFNPITNISLPLLPSTFNSPNPLVYCSSDGNCVASLRVKLTPGYAGVYNLNNLDRI